MVSEFLCECHGHIRITQDEATQNNLNSTIARVIIHPGANDDGYWKNEHVAAQFLTSSIHLTGIKVYFALTTPAITDVMPPML